MDIPKNQLRKNSDIFSEKFRQILGKNPIKCRNYSMGKISSTLRVSSQQNSHSKYNSNFFLRKIGVLLWILREINLGKFHRKSSDIFSEKFRLILGKILRNFSLLTTRIFCFTEDGSSEELT
jgi:hypothetical protein